MQDYNNISVDNEDRKRLKFINITFWFIQTMLQAKYMVNSESKTKQHVDFLTAAIHSKSIAADKLQQYKRIQFKPTLWRPS